MSHLMNALQELHERMQDPANWNSAGICENLDLRHLNLGTCREAICRKQFLMKEWPEYSGLEMYPVPAPEGADNAYNNGSPDDMWDRSKPYGAKRWELLEWMMRQEAGL